VAELFISLQPTNVTKVADAGISSGLFLHDVNAQFCLLLPMKRKKLLSLMLMISISQLVFATSCNSGSDQLKIDKNAFLVDVRTPEEFLAGTVEGAVNIPLDEIASRITEFEGKGQIVVFCRSGNRSSQAKSILDQQGIPNVMDGGTWQHVKQTIERQ
jgi:phage shock protein E